jgi:peroxiredoxin
MINLNEKIKGFSLKDQENKDFDIKELKGKRVLLSFHPLAFTNICALQMKSLEDNLEQFSALKTVPLGFSVDQQFCKAAWAKEIGIKNVRLLADFWPHGGVAKSLGIFREKEGFSERANIIVDEEGKVIFAKIYPMKEVPDIDEILNFLKKK